GGRSRDRDLRFRPPLGGFGRPGKIVQRQVTQIISPGTVTEFAMLEANRANYLAAIVPSTKRTGLALVDLSTGEFRVTEVGTHAELEDELARARPAEILVPDDALEELPQIDATGADAYAFDLEHARQVLLDQFRVHSLDGFGLPRDAVAAVRAAGGALHYLRQELRRDVAHLRALRWFSNEGCLLLDAATQANLELVESRGGSRDTSLLGALDRTKTPLGGRRLRHWILHPLRDVAQIIERQDLIAAFLAEPFLLGQTREALSAVRDLERILARLSQGTCNPRDLAALGASLEQIPDLRDQLLALPSSSQGLAARFLNTLHEQPEVVALLRKALVPEPPALVRDGGIFRDGYDVALDELRRASVEGKDWIARLQQKEIDRTGIKSLKVRFNSVFGYYIEITKANLENVPEDYQRKQTTVNGERFVTPELKEVEAKILGADERSRALEAELFAELRRAILAHIDSMQQSADTLADLDALTALAETARQQSYTRPLIDSSGIIEIKEGRHPVLDQVLEGGRFVPNDLRLDAETHRLLVITGPNMAGKSTYIRQAALLVLMAQMGSFLPCESARIGVRDRIFTRVGASDDLARGQSTFMVEMNETAAIINNATANSLVVLDEIGRGTSTFDGIAIAWSVAEHLHNQIGCHTLFATHYHELTDLEALLPGVKNYTVAVREWKDDIVFLRKIIRGAADKSYGIQVGRLAGLPDTVIERAKEILRNLEKGEFSPDGRPRLAEKSRRLVEPTPQLNLF
ncbi:MAG: DNA mismatch repair protein MutS, partial [Verrucomicrobiia bacterium]